MTAEYAVLIAVLALALRVEISFRGHQKNERETSGRVAVAKLAEHRNRLGVSVHRDQGVDVLSTHRPAGTPDAQGDESVLSPASRTRRKTL